MGIYKTGCGVISDKEFISNVPCLPGKNSSYEMHFVYLVNLCYCSDINFTPVPGIALVSCFGPESSSVTQHSEGSHSAAIHVVPEPQAFRTSFKICDFFVVVFCVVFIFYFKYRQLHQHYSTCYLMLKNHFCRV